MRNAFLGAALLGLVPCAARAQTEPLPPLPPPSESPPLPVGAPPMPPPPAPPPRPPPPPAAFRFGCGDPWGRHCHDGFYLRLGVGLSYTGVWGQGPSGAASIEGTGVALSALVGGAVAKGFVIGGGARIVDGVGVFKGAPGDAPGNGTATYVDVLSAFVDWFPDPENGWHVGAEAGVGITAITDVLSRDSSASNFGGTVFGGYDWWVGPQWSVGINASISAATSSTLSDDHNYATGYSVHPASFGLEATVLCN